jgi:hypothetical protein
MKIKAKDFDAIAEDIGKAATADFQDAEAKEFSAGLAGLKDALVVGAKK